MSNIGDFINNIFQSFLTWTNTYESIFAFIVLLLTIFSAVFLPLYKLIIAPKPKVKVSFEEGDSLTIYPEYVHTIRKEQKIQSGGYVFGAYNDWKYRDTAPPIVNTERDSRLCEVCLYIENTGKIALNDYSVNVLFEKGKVEKLETDMIVDADLDASVKTDSLKLKSKAPLKKRETKDFSFYIMPCDGVKDIKAMWTFMSGYLEKRGELTIHVEPRLKTE